jgi:SPP1 family predicted phage head-tail adaptor
VSEDRIPPIGTLTDRIQLMRKITTSEPEGGEVAVYSPIATVWARVKQLAARQSFAEDARGQGISHSVALRFRSDLKPGDRVVYRGRNLEIGGVADINGRRAYLSLQCSERVVTG